MSYVKHLSVRPPLKSYAVSHNTRGRISWKFLLPCLPDYVVVSRDQKLSILGIFNNRHPDYAQLVGIVAIATCTDLTSPTP